MNGWGNKDAETYIALQFSATGNDDKWDKDTFQTQLKSKLPDGARIDGVYRDRNGDVVVKLLLTSIQMLRSLNDCLLRTRDKLSIALNDAQYRPNASYFAEVYESTVLKLNKLSAEQKQVVDVICEEPLPNAHIRGPAGSGKHLLRSTLR